MQFKAKDIGEDGVDVDLAITPAWMEANCAGIAGVAGGVEVRPAARGLRFQGRLEPSGDDYLLRGQLAGALTTTCSRCLEPAQLPLQNDVSVLFVEQEPDDADDEEALDAPDVMTFENGVIDLGAELRDEILLAIPTQVLCKEDCAGLCPVCGENRNLTPCDCAEKQRLAQSKFASLGKLKI
jgi:uncharacterized protein